tara:strand:- start:1185 stop:1445 length:261 start_codon:yes stop_codon:yes gene_type:complete
MAKRKTKKAEKPTKIGNEQLDKLQTIVNSINKAQMQIGVFQTNIHQLLHHVAGKNDELLLMQEEIEKQYGTTDINILDGTINYEAN